MYLKQSYWLLVGRLYSYSTPSPSTTATREIAYPRYILSIILLLAVMVGGKTVSGSKRWLGAGFFTFQPSELVKIAIILVLARHFHRLAPEGSLYSRTSSTPWCSSSSPWPSSPNSPIWAPPYS